MGSLNLQDIFALNLAKLSSSLIKKLRLGSGSALPGRVALKISPQILSHFKNNLGKNRIDFFVTGTNGKTTTTGILKQICQEYLKEEIISNEMGANLYYGIVSEFVNSSNSSGDLKSCNMVLELDEASLASVAKELKPSTVIVTNIFRDQLDRFGELDSTLKFIVQGIKAGDVKKVVYNADDSNLAKLPEILDLEFYSFRVESETKIKNFDSKEFKVEDSDFFTTILKQDLESSFIEIGDSKDRIQVELKLPGLYNIYNATAAAACAYVNGIDLATIKKGIESYKVNFGRSETKIYKGKELKIFLIKNPTGCSEVLKHIVNDDLASFMIVLNDNYADGRDVSWIWDAEFEHLNRSNKKIFCAGHRARDLALRLKYAGIKENKIFVDENIFDTLDLAISNLESRLYLLPTYTALLEINKKLC